MSKQRSFCFFKQNFYILCFYLTLAVTLPCQVQATELTPTDSASLDTYLQLYQRYPETLGPLGNHRDSEIQIILDPSEIRNIQRASKEKMIANGASDLWAQNASKVGIISDDIYWYFLRDAVIFPSGFKGLYDRVVPKSSLTGTTGVVTAPLLPDGRIVLILNFRHATRSWELELPRGARAAHETIEQAATRETFEETGYRLQNPTLLGYVLPDSGMASSSSAVLVGFATEKRSSQCDESEAIKGVVTLTKAQIRQAYQRGYVEISMGGQMLKLPIKDPYLPYVLLVAEQKNLW